jgi:hypothetical protein
MREKNCLLNSRPSEPPTPHGRTTEPMCETRVDLELLGNENESNWRELINRHPDALRADGSHARS